MKFAFIDTEKAHMCLSRLCAFAGVSISGCYAWKHRGPSSHQLNNMIILAHIRNQFALSRKTSGSPRMHVEINEDGIRVGRHRTARLMRENGLKARQKMRFKRTTDSHHGEPVAPNLLDQDFTCDVTGVASAPSPPRPMFCGWFRPRHNCKTGLRGLLSVIHKDPVKLRVALLAADPPDKTATQPIPFSRTEFCSARCLNCEKSPMRTLSNYRQEWFSNIRGDVFSGIVVALALIPEAIGFSVIAGVDPKVGLYASFAIACVAAFVGGRPGMISAATAATAVVMISLVKEHGLQYLFASTILMGVIQIVAGWMRLGRVMRFVSRSVITGFVNALAILILMAQLPELIGVPTLTYVMIAGGLAIIYLFPYVTKAIPSPLVAIAVLTAMA